MWSPVEGSHVRFLFWQARIKVDGVVHIAGKKLQERCGRLHAVHYGEHLIALRSRQARLILQCAHHHEAQRRHRPGGDQLAIEHGEGQLTHEQIAERGAACDVHAQ